MAAVAARLWEAHRRVHNQVEQVPRSEQIGDKHVYHWFTDAANYYALRHFPELLRLKSGAATRMEHTHSIGEGFTIQLNTQDTGKETPLVANCLSLAALFLGGLDAAWAFIIDEACWPRSIPGDAGYRVTLLPDGTEERTRYFAVTFAKTYYTRFVQASRDNDHDALPGIFHATMVRIGDVMGQGRQHADTACKLVCEEMHALWYVPKATPQAIRGPKPGGGAPRKPGDVEQRSGRCYDYDNKGHCRKGNLCPYRGAHNSAATPKRPREAEYYSEEDRRSPPRQQPRREEAARPREPRRDAPRDKARERSPRDRRPNR